MNLLKFSAGVAVGLIMFDAAVQAAPMPPVGQWQCVATNNRGMRWVANSADHHQALRKARQRCYAQGSHHCYVSKNSCRYNEGKFWTCRVRDHRGRIWKRSNVQAGVACHEAKYACRHWHNQRGINNFMCKVVAERRT